MLTVVPIFYALILWSFLGLFLFVYAFPYIGHRKVYYFFIVVVGGPVVWIAEYFEYKLRIKTEKS
ncbi:MAG: hypothetical protein HQ536_04380 [Parcubacteria group bacterium]|nr:hypothetical protein [Parcubacteria group bacterium]